MQSAFEDRESPPLNMETTFITIHDLSLDARILYVSNSIQDILHYRPEEVVGRSCWDYFHPSEIPFAQAVHGRGIQLDKAAVLNYCQIRNKEGYWIGCECVFTIVYDVLIGCTSIYRQGPRSQKRANEAPIIRQLFSSSPRDPRYHMLSYISAKFAQGPRPHTHEPRAAIFLNRFTRSLTIMYATNGLEKLLGINADELIGKSFYYCIKENCLHEAIRCLENAKANDSLAYLRFWYRDPRQDSPYEMDESMSDVRSTASEVDDDEGGVPLSAQMDTSGSDTMQPTPTSTSPSPRHNGTVHRHSNSSGSPSQTRSMDEGSNSTQSQTPDAVFEPPAHNTSSRSSIQGMDTAPDLGPFKTDQTKRAVELEAVVSCTSDGLVVVLRAARPLILDSLRPVAPRVPEARLDNGFFATPWAMQPEISVVPQSRAQSSPRDQPPFRNQLVPTRTQHFEYPSRENGWTPVAQAAGGPAVEAFMESIRDVAAFAWALTGINGSLAQYSRGNPQPGAQPPGGLPVWERDPGDIT